MTDPDNVMNPLHFATDPTDIRINPKIRIWISDHFWLKFWWKWRRPLLVDMDN